MSLTRSQAKAPIGPTTKPALRLQGPNTHLPWSTRNQEDALFAKLVRIGIIAALVLGIVIALIPVPELTREEAEKLPPQLAKVVLKKKELPKPKKKPEPKKEPKKPEPKKQPDKKPEPKPVKEKPKPAKVLTPEVQKARKKAATSGLLQFQDDLMSMRDSLDTNKLNNQNLSRGQASAQKTERSVIANSAKTKSGGVNTAALSTDTGGSALSGKENTQVESTLATAAEAEETARARASGQRSQEEIRDIMARNKGALYAIYNRALRKDPSLEGRVRIKMVIDPSGAITDLTLVSSELGDAALERKLLSRIRLINFGNQSVSPTTVNYDFDFLPF